MILVKCIYLDYDGHLICVRVSSVKVCQSIHIFMYCSEWDSGQEMSIAILFKTYTSVNSHRPEGYLQTELFTGVVAVDSS